MGRTIKITVESKLSVAPDRLQIHVNLDKLMSDYAEAMHYASNATKEMTAVVERAGLPASDLKTYSWNIAAEYEYRMNESRGQVKVFAGYRYHQSFMLEIVVDNEQLGRILSEMIQSELEPEVRLQYTVADLEPYKDKLLEQAIANARHKAEVIARAEGMQLGKVLTTEYCWKQGDTEGDAGHMMKVPRTMAVRSFSAPDITPADIELSETVTIIWEI